MGKLPDYPEIRKRLEAQGLVLTDEEYAEQVRYARRKCEVNGKGEDYMPLLLPDVIKEYLMRSYINMVTMAKYSESRA